MKKIGFILVLFLLINCSKKDEITPITIPNNSKLQYSLNISAQVGGKVTTESGKFDEGTEIQIEAKVNSGFIFDGWSDGSIENPKTIVLNKDLTIEARFISLPDYFNKVFSKSSIPNLSSANKSTDNFNKSYRPFYDYNSFINRVQYEYVYVRDNGDVGLNPAPRIENHNHEQLFAQFLNINNNEIPDFIISGNNIRTENTGEIYVIVDNKLKYKFDSQQTSTRKILTGDLDNNGSDDIVLIATGIDQEPYTGASTKIIYFSPESYEMVELDPVKSYYHTGALGDLNNDGNLDLMIVNNQNRVSDGSTFVYLGDGNRGFTKVFQGKDWPTENNPDSFGLRFNMEFFDLNNDGNLDMIIGGHEMPDLNWGRAHRTSIYYGNGDGTFDYSNPILLPEIDYWGIINDFKFYDIDNDGLVEIIINRTTGHEDYNIVENDKSYDGIKIQILKKEGNDYVNHQIIDCPSNWFDLPPTWIEWIPFIELFDVNGDGLLDICPDSEGISNPNFNPLKRFWGMYYRATASGKYELDYFNPNKPK